MPSLTSITSYREKSFEIVFPDIGYLSHERCYLLVFRRLIHYFKDSKNASFWNILIYGKNLLILRLVFPIYKNLNHHFDEIIRYY